MILRIVPVFKSYPKDMKGRLGPKKIEVLKKGSAAAGNVVNLLRIISHKLSKEYFL